ncbi:NAD(P)H-dependent oxidoreductase [bacterium]|nr:NAD(P)H-dependent oxidoreductase [bacterium]
MEYKPEWQIIGEIKELAQKPLQEISISKTKIALTYLDGNFSAVSGFCNHSGGPLGRGKLSDGYITCPWHNWKFHHKTGKGEPGFESDCIPTYLLKIEGDKLLIDLASASPRHKSPHAAHPLAREVKRSPGPIRVLGISTTNMDESNPRTSTSDLLLEVAIKHASATLKAEVQTIRLSQLQFRACEGYYSKAARACTWPCSITQMDPEDQMEKVYEAFVHWADVVVIATPIRWGNASSLYYKMVERMNCVQNQITIANRQLITNKVVSMIITGGQDNIQSVAGQLLGFFSEIGCTFPPFPYIAHSRGWTAEDMEKNVIQVSESKDLRSGAQALVERSIETVKMMIETEQEKKLERGGRKDHDLA